MIDKQFNVNRLIRIYSNKTELVVSEIEVRFYDVAKFQKLFNVSDYKNPMFDCYEITEEITQEIETHMSSVPNWDFEKYSYYLEANAV